MNILPLYVPSDMWPAVYQNWHSDKTERELNSVTTGSNDLPCLERFTILFFFFDQALQENKVSLVCSFDAANDVMVSVHA